METIFESDFKKILHCFEETYARQMQDTTFLNKICSILKIYEL